MWATAWTYAGVLPSSATYAPPPELMQVVGAFCFTFTQAGNLNNFDGTLGQVAFESFCENGGAYQYYGHLITDWAQLGPREQAAWYAQAIAVVEQTFKTRRDVRAVGRKVRRLTG